jgi:hypothetical protein
MRAAAIAAAEKAASDTSRLFEIISMELSLLLHRNALVYLNRNQACGQTI